MPNNEVALLSCNQNKALMRQFIKTTIFIITMGSLIVFSSPIQQKIVKTYNHCIEQMANKSIASGHLNGF